MTLSIMKDAMSNFIDACQYAKLKYLTFRKMI